MKSFFIEATSPSGLSTTEIQNLLSDALASCKPLKKVLLIPPDITRLFSYAGPMTQMLYHMLPDTEIHILPALGTHAPMTNAELDKMYTGVPKDRFFTHNWRTDIVKLGEIPGDFVAQVSEGRMTDPIPVEINKMLLDPSYDLILSIGQVLPHEVVGMANYTKNIFVGCGGSHMIHASHYLGALYGMERMMGRDHTPVHEIFNYAQSHFISQLPISYLLTVTTVDASGNISLKSLSAGPNRELFSKSIAVSQKHNLNFLEQPLKKVVAYLDPEKFHTTWLGNKAIYRTRMAMADCGELIIIAPGIKGFGEDMQNDTLIRKYGYWGRDRILQLTQENDDLKQNLSVAAHLIHGSSDGRFSITYAPGGLTAEEIQHAGFSYLPLAIAMEQYNISALQDGFQIVNGEEIFFISNPSAGLWAETDRFYSTT